MDVLRGMQVFTAVVDAGSFAGAARKLDLAPAVVTRLVAELENHLGARLLNRTTRRLALTDVGDAYLQRARGILSEVDEAHTLAAAATTQAQGHLRVLIGPALAMWLARRLPQFRQAYPKVTLELSSWGMVTAPDDNYDVSVLTVSAGATLQGGYVARLLARSEVVISASPQYLARHPAVRHPRDLATHECLLPTLPNQPREMVVYHMESEQRIGVTPSIALISNHADTLHSAAVAGMGLLVMSSYLMEESLRTGALVRVLPHWHVARYHIYAAIPSRQHLPLRTRVFLDFLVQCLGGKDRDPWLASTPPAAAARAAAKKK